MNTTTPSIFFVYAVIVRAGTEKVLHEMDGVFEPAVTPLQSPDYGKLRDDLAKVIIEDYQLNGGKFDPEKHRVIVRSLSRLQ